MVILDYRHVNGGGMFEGASGQDERIAALTPRLAGSLGRGGR
jgi:hypothetical protein